MFDLIKKREGARVFLALIFFLPFILFTANPPLFADREIAYDPYASILKYPEAVQPHVAERRGRLQFFARILEQPIRPIGYSLGKTA